MTYVHFLALKEVEDTSDEYYTETTQSEDPDSDTNFAMKESIVEEGIKAGERLAAKV